MREALRALEANGILEFRHGAGVFVRDSGQRIVIANRALSLPDKSVVLELLVSRLLIEPYLASRAADRVTDDDLDRLERLLQAAELHLADDERLSPLNMDFHLEIARLSGHRTLHQILESLVELYAQTQGVILVIHGDRDRDHRQHRQILETLRSRQPENARNTMKDHLSDVLALVSAHLDQG